MLLNCSLLHVFALSLSFLLFLSHCHCLYLRLSKSSTKKIFIDIICSQLDAVSVIVVFSIWLPSDLNDQKVFYMLLSNLSYNSYSNWFRFAFRLLASKKWQISIQSVNYGQVFFVFSVLLSFLAWWEMFYTLLALAAYSSESNHFFLPFFSSHFFFAFCIHAWM